MEKGDRQKIVFSFSGPLRAPFLRNRALQTFSQPPTGQGDASLLNCFSELDQILFLISSRLPSDSEGERLNDMFIILVQIGLTKDSSSLRSGTNVH